MTATLLGHVLGSTLLAAPLAMLAWWLGRSGRRPALADVVWVAVLVRLVMPPFAEIGWLPLRVPVPGAAVAERNAAMTVPAVARADRRTAGSPAKASLEVTNGSIRITRS